MRRALYIYGALTVLLLAAVPAGATGAWQNGAELVSASVEKQEQGNAPTTASAISSDGRFVAFETRATNLFNDQDPPGVDRIGGIFRKDLQSGALELVAEGDTRYEGLDLLLFQGARRPSLSADGRFVAFDSAQQLAPQDGNQNRDVYVRDMSIPIGQPGAFELASAKDGSDAAPAYVGVSGSDTPVGTAISSDGTKVLFRTQVTSNLPDHAAADVGPGQLFVRDRNAKATTLVTRSATDGQPAGGAEVPSAISGDGTTVVWVGSNAAAQTPFLAGESPVETEPYYLWRRVADGPSAKTRRVTGRADLDNPGCPSDSQYVLNDTDTGPCYGPLIEAEGVQFSNITGRKPAISADGRYVAFLTAARPRPFVTSGRFYDAFVTDMSEGVSRKQGTVELTRDPSGEDLNNASSIENLTLSADGRWLAFATTRIQFTLSPPVFVGDPATTWGNQEVYVVDLERLEIERAVRALGGGEVNGSSGSLLSMSADGSKLAFTSEATDLFAGDLNGFQDAFVTERVEQAGTGDATGADVGALGESRSGNARLKKRLALTVGRLAGGRLRVQVRVPEAGILHVRATASVKKKRRRAGRSRTRILARARSNAKAAGTQTVLLRLSSRHLARITSRKRIRVRLGVSFAPAVRSEALRAERMVTLKR